MASNPVVFFDIAANGTKLGRIEMTVPLFFPFLTQLDYLMVALRGPTPTQQPTCVFFGRCLTAMLRLRAAAFGRGT